MSTLGGGRRRGAPLARRWSSWAAASIIVTHAHAIFSLAILAPLLWAPLKNFRRSTPAQIAMWRQTPEDTWPDEAGDWWGSSGAASSAEQRGDAQQHQRRLQELDDKIQALEQAIERLQDQVRELSGELAQLRSPPTGTAASRTCESRGCNRRYGPDADGYLHRFCCRTCKGNPCSHGDHCDERCDEGGERGF